MSHPRSDTPLAKLRRSRIVWMAGGLFLAAGLVYGGYNVAMAQMAGHGHHGADRHAQMHAQTHGADGMGHDETNMPGLRGLDATDQESTELALMFNNFEAITRSVENLPNGIRTVTMSDDPALLDVITSHVMGMIDRVETGRDPKIFIQSPTLDILFERRDSITTELDFTETGVVVIQTSDDAEVVAALQIHAVEVTDMVDRGMDAVHDAMMKRASN